MNHNMIDHVLRMEKVNYGHTTGVKIVMLTYLYVMLLVNNFMGEHISIGVGITPLEASIKLGLWFRKPWQEEYGTL